jgi:hypothetical protein
VEDEVDQDRGLDLLASHGWDQFHRRAEDESLSGRGQEFAIASVIFLKAVAKSTMA